jgi:Excalibur calcium-binding domain
LGFEARALGDKAGLWETRDAVVLLHRYEEGKMVSAVRLGLLVAAVVVFAALASPSAVGVPKVTSPSASALVPRKYPNCTALRRRYLHGVGRWGARDRTSGVPVTTFRRSNLLYRLNSHLDRDGDKIACEKR